MNRWQIVVHSMRSWIWTCDAQRITTACESSNGTTARNSRPRTVAIPFLAPCDRQTDLTGPPMRANAITTSGPPLCLLMPHSHIAAPLQRPLANSGFSMINGVPQLMSQRHAPNPIWGSTTNPDRWMTAKTVASARRRAARRSISCKGRAAGGNETVCVPSVCTLQGAARGANGPWMATMRWWMLRVSVGKPESQ